MSPPAPDLAFFLDRGGWSSATLLAGRPFHFTYESLLLKLLIMVDMPSMIATWPASMVLSIELGTYLASYVTAGLMLFGASYQWLLAGYGLERWLESSGKDYRFRQQVNRRFRMAIVIILATTAVLTPITLERSRRLGFRHGGISFR